MSQDFPQKVLMHFKRGMTAVGSFALYLIFLYESVFTI